MWCSSRLSHPHLARTALNEHAALWWRRIGMLHFTSHARGVAQGMMPGKLVRGSLLLPPTAVPSKAHNPLNPTDICRASSTDGSREGILRRQLWSNWFFTLDSMCSQPARHSQHQSRARRRRRTGLCCLARSRGPSPAQTLHTLHTCTRFDACFLGQSASSSDQKQAQVFRNKRFLVDLCTARSDCSACQLSPVAESSSRQARLEHV